MKKIILITLFSIAAVAQTAAPTLTEVERLKLELLATKRQNLELQASAIREAQSKLDSEIGAFLEAVKAAHPGYELGANGQLQPIAKPEPKK